MTSNDARPCRPARPRPGVRALGTGLLAVALLTGCAAESESDSAGSVEAVPAVAEVTGVSPVEAQQLVTTASVDVVVSDPVVAALEISRLVEQAGGRVDERYETAPGDGSEPSANLTVRVPSDRMTATLDALEDVGTVERTQIVSTDVSATATDLDARIDSLRVSVERLEELMGDASSTADLLEAESTLTTRQAELESLVSQRDRLADQVDLSTLEVSLTTSPTPAKIEDEGFRDGLATGWDALVATVGVVVVVLGTLLPWLAVGAAVVLVVRWLVRVVRRRRKPTASSPGSQGGRPGDGQGGHGEDGSHGPASPPPGGHVPDEGGAPSDEHGTPRPLVHS
ncbi:DUF4349 domain-containing protein [Sanguibacter suaedae]|uniref:DUF4349 domain-containing protein n=1 Tax=Sanguibacter suaedae TaxID=2795737 RepID=A0A934IC22_9MICO|nr:DUF4349 domain-containing protein [Sanguibacter suaedae]MBI9115101.1 DUF4349 domain-containing protein [Sanguibacter suaedae]